MNIVLYEPEIPHNTGAIGRTCVATGTNLHLIEPLGFKISDKYLKRSGLDYWDKLNCFLYSSFSDFLEKNNYPKVIMATTKAKRIYTDINYNANSFIMFGKESAGIPEEILVENEENCVRIPMWGNIRSLNLANSVSILLYEAYRQIGFDGLEKMGDLHRLNWK